jgi:signal peptide peptidase SppA
MNFVRESVIVSAIRTFCTSFAAVIGILIGIALVFMGLGMISGSGLYPPKSELMIAPDAEGNRELLPASAPVILKVDISGVIGTKDLNVSTFKELLLDSRQNMLAHDRVKAVLLCIDTPGGTVTDADGIYRMLMDYKEKYKVPVFAFVDGMCASGGMYVASSADKIYATPASVIGSVGVILGPTFNFSELMSRYGIQALTITQGKDKDALNPFRPWKEGEDASIRAITASLYDRFVSIVTTARTRISKEDLINNYGAQIYVSSQAADYGYIDVADSDYATAVKDLAMAANIAEETPYQVMNIGPAHSFLSELAQGECSLLKGKVTHSLQLTPQMTPELSGKFLYLYQPD